MVKQTLKKIRKKLDKNNDGLITLDEYLADEESTGPYAGMGNIGYYYQHYDNIYSYFKLVLRGFTKFNILCVPNFIVKEGNTVDRTSMIINVNDKSIVYGTKMIEAINNCKIKKSTRFIFFSLILKFKNKNLTHANMVVIDLVKYTLERFEPHGSTFYFNEDSIKENKMVNKIMLKQVLPDLKLKNFTYISPQKLSPLIGIQRVADSYCGMCITISMMYLHLRILNPDVAQPKLVKFLLNRSKEKLKIMILKYAKHVEDTLKKNENYVLKLLDEVIKELL